MGNIPKLAYNYQIDIDFKEVFKRFSLYMEIFLFDMKSK